MIDPKTHKIIAKCYAVYGWHRYYRTESGDTFAITNGKHYFYFGNVKIERREPEYLTGERLEEIKNIVLFVDDD